MAREFRGKSNVNSGALSVCGAWASSLAGLAALTLLVACAGPSTVAAVPPVPVQSASPTEPLELASLAQIRKGEKRLECVTYARQVTGMDMRGDAWRWWDNSRGRYQRGAAPEAGGVLVFHRINGSPGHVAVVNEVVSDRLVIASHANWLNDGRIHENTPIQDVSAKGDWSAVRVWYTPGQQWGRSTYRTYGFVYSRQPMTASATPAGS